MDIVSPEDYIRVESLISLCPQKFDKENEPDEGVVFCDPESIDLLFKNFTKKKYTVVSCGSDASIVLQEQNPVNRDIMWYTDILREISQMPPDTQYQIAQLPPRCRLERCSLADKYSVKYVSYTQSTFPEIPDNIQHWYTCNAIIEDERVTQIPFGIAKTDDTVFKPIPWQDKTKLLYVNFDIFSHPARQSWKRYFANQPWVTYVDKPVSHEQYAKDLAEHKFVLSPPGNGPDCYRHWEAVYAGSVPILQENGFKLPEGVPVVIAENLYLTEQVVKDAWTMMVLQENKTCLDKAKLSYWRNVIGI